MRVNVIINVHWNLIFAVVTDGCARFACRSVDVAQNNVEYSTTVPEVLLTSARRVTSLRDRRSSDAILLSRVTRAVFEAASR